MIRLILLCILLLLCINGYGKTILFLSKNNFPIANVQCVGYSSSNDSITSWISNEKGLIDTMSVEVNYIIASKSGFRDKFIFFKSLAPNDTIIMLPEVELNEVVVTPSDVEEFATHTSYRISQKDMARYSTVLQSLNEIPNLTVLSNGSVFFEGNQNIKILIDGIDATIQEVQTLSKEDIAKVNVYQIPPLRFIAQGVSAVVDIRLKSKIHGGNGALEISQAFYPLNGNNSAAVYYNNRQSRFSLLYTNENKHYRKYRKSEILDYNFDGVNYNKTKNGLNSKNHYDDNNVKLSYQINRANNYLYSIKSGISVNHDGGISKQNVTAGDQFCTATNLLQTAYTKYNIGNYFEKKIGDKYGCILANVTFQHFSTSYNSEYNELNENQNAFNNSHSNYKTHLNAIFSEVQYQLPTNRLGYFTICGYETYKHSKYIDTELPFYQKINIAGGVIQWMASKRSINWYVSIGVDWYHISSTTLTKSHNLCMPSPLANINWRISNNTQLSFEYSYTGNVPSIAQLSETNQWLDTKLVYHGNSTLKPYKTHSGMVRFIWNNKYLNLSLKNSFKSSPGMICDMYSKTDKFMLQTMVNLSKYKIWNSQIDLSIMPLGNNKLVFWNRIIFADIKGKNQIYSWDGYRFQWMSNLAINLEHWTIDLFYQYPGKIVEGQLERPRAQCWSSSVMYRPVTNLSVGIEWFMPFGKGFKESEHTVNEAPVYANSESKIIDLSNMLSIKLSYNFSFGRNKNSAAPQYDNIDYDSGVLIKK